MKVLITGATGLIGKELSKALIKKGIGVHYLTTSTKTLPDNPDYRGFHWNPEKGVIDQSCINGVDAVVHLAGATIFKRWTDKYKQEIIESRTLSSNLLYKLLRTNPDHQVRQVVSASAIGIYKDSLKNVYYEDTKIFDDGFLGNVVIKWEQSVDKFRLLPVKVCKIRTGIVLSEKGGALEQMARPVRFGVGSAYGSGQQWQSWIHVDDLVQLYITALQKGWEGVVNGVAPHPVSNSELIKSIAKTLHKPFFMPNVPEFIMQLALGEMHQLVYTSQNVLPSRAQHEGFVFKYPQLGPALENLLAEK